MLNIRRKENQSVVVFLPSGETLLITVREIDGKKITLGFEGPRDIQIWRTELLEQATGECE